MKLEFELMCFDRNTGEIAVGMIPEITESFARLIKEYTTVEELNKLSISVYHEGMLQLWKKDSDKKRTLFVLLGRLQHLRKLKVNYEELHRLIEFLCMHDSDFKVTNIDDENDTMIIHLI